MTTKNTFKKQFLTYTVQGGKPGRCAWPSGYARAESEKHITIRLNEPTPDNLDGIDSWAIACHWAFVTKHPEAMPKLSLDIRGEAVAPCLESLVRRVSYLQIVNDFTISLKLNTKPIPLYSYEELMQLGEVQVICDRADAELTVEPIPQIGADTTLMFDPQDVIDQLKTYLKGKSFGRCPARCASGQSLLMIDTFSRLNLKHSRALGSTSRLAIFGDEFRHYPRSGVVRHFPTAAFKDYVSEKNRILPDGIIDLIAVNRTGRPSLITFSLGDVALSTLSTALNNALYVALYHSQLQENPEVAEVVKKSATAGFLHYISGSSFHPMFDAVAAYYRPGAPFDFEFRKIRVCNVESI